MQAMYGQICGPTTRCKPTSTKMTPAAWIQTSATWYDLTRGIDVMKSVASSTLRCEYKRKYQVICTRVSAVSFKTHSCHTVDCDYGDIAG